MWKEYSKNRSALYNGDKLEAGWYAGTKDKGREDKEKIQGSIKDSWGKMWGSHAHEEEREGRQGRAVIKGKQ